MCETSLDPNYDTSFPHRILHSTLVTSQRVNLSKDQNREFKKKKNLDEEKYKNIISKLLAVQFY